MVDTFEETTPLFRLLLLQLRAGHTKFIQSSQYYSRIQPEVYLPHRAAKS